MALTIPSPISRAKALTIAPSICNLKYSIDSFSAHYVANPPYKKLTFQTSGMTDVDLIETKWMESAGFQLLFSHHEAYAVPNSYLSTLCHQYFVKTGLPQTHLTYLLQQSGFTETMGTTGTS